MAQLRETEVTLRIKWNSEIEDHPMDWDWSTLLDASPTETVELVRSREIR